MNVRAFLNTLSDRSRTLPIVILYVTGQCNLKCITCSFREALPDELSLEEIQKLAAELRQRGLRHIVYSGGEPLVRRDFPRICDAFRKSDARQTLLTNGLLLGKRREEITGFPGEIIVSLDGADAETHDAIRGVESFDRIVEGMKQIIDQKNGTTVSIRTVLQKKNFPQLESMVMLAESLGVERISFLAADVLSPAFGRDMHGPAASREEILLTHEETLAFRGLVQHLTASRRHWFDRRFIAQSPDALFHIVQYYEAMIGRASFPRNVCNAPMVSAVIGSTGEILPCYFLEGYGNIRSTSLEELLNSRSIRSMRRNVRRSRLERCKTCVCTLHVEPHAALFDRF